MARIPKLQQDMPFICALREAHLDNGVGLKGEALERLRNPPSYPATVDDPGIDFAPSMFLALEHSSEAGYEDIRTAAHRCLNLWWVPHPGTDTECNHLLVCKIEMDIFTRRTKFKAF
ncbi:hypothetical protein BDR05DRAFT_1005614 [Suillus weaverae]|nr:hypothetical protein BDR05DRAFT_1005614 [Suillus weaverae]